MDGELAYGQSKPLSEVSEGSTGLSVTDKNRSIGMHKLADGTYMLCLRAVYTGPKVFKTIRRISRTGMVSIVQIWMMLNGYKSVKIVDGQLMYSSDE